jgi:ATP-dependent Lon protease
MSEVRADFSLPASIPEELPVLPLLRGVLLPGSFSPYNVGRASSIAALDHVVGNLILVVPQASADREPGVNDLLAMGTLGRIVKNERRNGGRFVLIQGLARVNIAAFSRSQPWFSARFDVVDPGWPDTAEAQGVGDAFDNLVKETAELLNEQGRAASLLDGMPHKGLAVDAVAAVLDTDEAFKRDMLFTIDPVTRAERVLVELARAREVIEARRRVEGRVRGEQRDRQREAVLRQQLDAIQKELGENDDDLAELNKKLDALNLPEEAREAVAKERKRLARVNAQSPERPTIIDWLTRVADLPWSQYSASDIDFDRLEQALDDSHTGLDDVKRQVLEYLSVRKLEGKGRADVLLLVGPPGVGKTSIGAAIAEATGRKLVRIALGGVRDEAELRGHRRTYIGSRPGRIIEGFKRAGTSDPVVLLDEVDKLQRGVLGDPASALLEILDPEQNHAFVDHYLELPYDLSRALFIATANDLSGIPGPLRDRMEIIELSGYTPAEKVVIARRHLLKKSAENAGLQPDDVDIDEDTLHAVVDGWTREAGVRQLQRTLGRLYRAAAVDKARGRREGPLVIREADLPKYLKRRIFLTEEHDPVNRAGIVNGLAWTPVGGDVLVVEASSMPGKGGLVLTGQLGDVMKESARAALTFVMSHAAELGIDPKLQEGRDIHIHLPAGAIPKDGPSAGITMFTAIASLLSGRPVRADTAMTGEATLRGRVLPVGGIKNKVLAAHQRGITRVILPARNARDLDELPEDVRRALTFVLVDSMESALEAALIDPPTLDALPPATPTWGAGEAH